MRTVTSDLWQEFLTMPNDRLESWVRIYYLFCSRFYLTRPLRKRDLQVAIGQGWVVPISSQWGWSYTDHGKKMAEVYEILRKFNDYVSVLETQASLSLAEA